MASLADTIKLNSGLASASTEELTALAGRPVAPTSPMEAGVIGGNPDQAKMAGVNSLRQAIQGNQDLATTQRLGQKRTAATGAEKADMAQAKKLGGLGSLADRVDTLAKSMMDEKLAKGAAATLAPVAGDATLTALLEKLRQNPGDFTIIQQINNYLNDKNKTPGKQLTGNEILGLYGTPEDAIAAQVGKTVGEAITSGKLPIKDMGFKDINELAGALETDVNTVTSMSIPQLIDKINQLTQTEFSKVSALEARSNDPRLGAAERAEARKQLRDMGAIGVRSAETDVDKLADQIANADKVEFMGKEMPIDELLSSKYMSGVVAQYLDGLDPTTGNPTSEFSKELAEKQPKLVEFIKKNQTVLQAVADKIDKGAKDFAALQVSNANISVAPNGEKLSDNLMKELYPDWGTLKTSGYDTKKYPFLDILKTAEPEQANQLVKFANNVFTQWPGLLPELASLSREELHQLGALGDTTQYAKFNDIISESRKIRDMKTMDDMAVILGLSSEKELRGLRDKLKQGVNWGGIQPWILQKVPGLYEGDFKKTFKWLQTQRPGTLRAIIGKDGKLMTELTKQIRANSNYKLDIAGQFEDVFKYKDKIDRSDILNGAKGASTADLYGFLSKWDGKFTKEGKAEMQKYLQNQINTEMTGGVEASLGGKVDDFIKGIMNTSFDKGVNKDAQAQADDFRSKAKTAAAAVADYLAKNKLPTSYGKALLDKITKAIGTINVQEYIVPNTDGSADTKKTEPTKSQPPRITQPGTLIINPGEDLPPLPATPEGTPTVNDNVVNGAGPGEVVVGYRDQNGNIISVEEYKGRQTRNTFNGTLDFSYYEPVYGKPPEAPKPRPKPVNIEEDNYGIPGFKRMSK
jgi:hypothetical protein